MRGLFITFEGSDGSGKTTQAEKLWEYLVAKGYKVIKTREPGGTPMGERIRDILLSTKYEGMNALTELFLFLASRVQHTLELILPFLEQGFLVISERYADSSIAYQAYGRGLEIRMVESLNTIATKGLKPDLTFLLDIEPEIALQKAVETIKGETIRGKGDRLEQEGLLFQKRVREGYLSLAQKEPERMKVIRGNRSIEEVQAEVRRYVDELLARSLSHG